jgi:crotonobetainyl-CoA:carnitine CoA-transferase CaiB-like acyl-CoA transferase
MTKFLADYGATVVRVESREHPCVTRTSGPYKDSKVGPDTTGYFAFFNSNKYSIVLELDKPKGLDVAKRLIAWSDVVVENFAPGKMAKLGLDYEQVRKIKSDIVMISSSGLGQTGDLSKLSIGGNWLVALSGFSWLSGWPDRDCVQPFGVYNDHIAPRYGVVAILAALFHKKRTGKGQYIDLSQLETGIQFLTPPLLDSIVNQRNPGRMGNASPHAAPHGVYPCLDGSWCAIAVFDDDEWKALCSLMGNPHWSKKEDFVTFLDRKQNEDKLNKCISEWTIKLDAEKVMERLQKKGISAGVVRSPRDLLEDPQLKYRNQFWVLNHKSIGQYPHLGAASVMSKTPAGPEMPSPCLGEHGQYICKEILDMSDEEFVELFNEGIF